MVLDFLDDVTVDDDQGFGFLDDVKIDEPVFAPTPESIKKPSKFTDLIDSAKATKERPVPVVQSTPEQQEPQELPAESDEQFEGLLKQAASTGKQFIEETVIAKGLIRGTINLGQSLLGATAFLGDLAGVNTSGIKTKAKGLKEVTQSQTLSNKEFKGLISFTDPEFVIGSIAEQAPLMSLSFGSAFLSSRSALGLFKALGYNADKAVKIAKGASILGSSGAIGTLEAGSFYNEAEELIAEGKMTRKKSMLVTPIVGILNGAIENLGGAFGADVVQNALFSKPGRRNLINLFADIAGEGLEETLQGRVTELMKAAGWDEVKQVFTDPEMLVDFVGGIVTAGPIALSTRTAQLRQDIERGIKEDEKGIPSEKHIKEPSVEDIQKEREVIEDVRKQSTEPKPEVSREGITEARQGETRELPEITKELPVVMEKEPALEKKEKPTIEIAEKAKPKQVIKKPTAIQEAFKKAEIKVETEKIAKQEEKERLSKTKREEIAEKKLQDIVLPKTVKGKIQQTTGIRDISEKVTATESQLLKEQIKSEARTAKEVAKNIRQETREIINHKIKLKETTIKEAREEVVNFANKHLEPEARGKLLPKVKNLTTSKDKEKAIEYIEQIADAVENRQEVSNVRKTIEKFKKEKFRPEFKTKIDAILKDVETKGLSKKKEKRLESMRSFIEENPQHLIPENKLMELDRLDNVSITDMTTEQIRLVNDSLRHIEKLNKLKNNIIVKGKIREFKKIKDEAVSNVKRKASVEADQNSINTDAKDKESGFAKKVFTVSSWNTEMISEILDKEKSGVINDIMYKGIDQGVTDQLRFQQEAMDYFKKQFSGIDISTWSKNFQTRRNQKKVDIQQIKLPSGKIAKMTKAERVAFYLHTLNNNNMRHLSKGGFSFSRAKTTINKLNQEDIDAIVQSITQDELTIANAVYDFFNIIQKAKLNQTSVELNGWEVAVEPSYYPIRTNKLDIFRDNLKQVVKVSDMRNFMQLSLEGLGIFKERTNANNAIILDDVFTAVSKSIQQSSAYIGLANPLRNAKALLNDRDFQITVTQTYGKEYIDNLTNYLKDMELNSYRTSEIESFIDRLNNNVTVSILGLNPWVILKQPISYVLAGTEIDSKYLLNIKPASKETVKKWSPQLRDRLSGNINRDLGEFNQAGFVNKLFNDKTDLKQLAIMGGIGQFDYESVGRIWTAVEKEAKDINKNLKPGSDEFFQHVAKRTEEIVRKTQPTFQPKDRSEIARNRQMFIRFLTKFSSQRNKNYIIIRRALEKYNRSDNNISDKANLFRDITLVGLISSALVVGVDKLRDLLLGRKERNGAPSDIVKVIGVAIGNVYFASNIFGSAISGFDVQDPVSQTFNETSELARNIFDASSQFLTQERNRVGNRRLGIRKFELKYKRSVMEAINKATNLFGRLKGLPVRNVKNIIKGIRNVGDMIMDKL